MDSVRQFCRNLYLDRREAYEFFRRRDRENKKRPWLDRHYKAKREAKAGAEASKGEEASAGPSKDAAPPTSRVEATTGPSNAAATAAAASDTGTVASSSSTTAADSATKSNRERSDDEPRSLNRKPSIQPSEKEEGSFGEPYAWLSRDSFIG